MNTEMTLAVIVLILGLVTLRSALIQYEKGARKVGVTLLLVTVLLLFEFLMIMERNGFELFLGYP